MAQTKRRRSRKHRGTQGGSIDRRGRAGRPRNRQEAQARARKQMGTRRTRGGPPSWSSAVGRGAIGAGIFFVLLVALFSRPVAPSLGLSAFMWLVYIPMGYYIERFFWRRREAQKPDSGR